MRRMENLTRVNDELCIEFRPITDDDDIFITIQNGSGCSAYVCSNKYEIKSRKKESFLVGWLSSKLYIRSYCYFDVCSTLYLYDNWNYST